MNDESSIWRTPPPGPHRPTGRRLFVPGRAVRATRDILASNGRVESHCLWLGPWSPADCRLSAIVTPRQVNRPFNYDVPPDAVAEVAKLARPRGWTVLGAIHSHPGDDVEHSGYDDQMTASRTAVSIVLPRYGRWEPTNWPHGLGVHEYVNAYWHLLDATQACNRVIITADGDFEKIDLR